MLLKDFASKYAQLTPVVKVAHVLNFISHVYLAKCQDFQRIIFMENFWVGVDDIPLKGGQNRNW